jgi:hypothetical protein
VGGGRVADSHVHQSRVVCGGARFRGVLILNMVHREASRSLVYLVALAESLVRI